MDGKELTEVNEALLATLRAAKGEHWKEVQGELHLQYGEMPFWILLYDDADLNDAHRAFRDAVADSLDRIEPVKITVAYTVYTEDEETHLDFLEGKEEILRAPEHHALGRFPETSKKKDTPFFTSATSRRES